MKLTDGVHMKLFILDSQIETKRFNATCFNFSNNYVSLLILGIESFPVERRGFSNEI